MEASREYCHLESYIPAICDVTGCSICKDLLITAKGGTA
jgi:hypothetical protein